MVTVEAATCIKFDTRITLILPKKAKTFITSKLRGNEISNREQERLWIEILNKFYTEDLKIDKSSILGFVVVEPENLSFKHETPNTQKKKKILPKTWSYWAKKAKKATRRVSE